MAPIIKDSWLFDIYEDTPEETLQNMMEHSTTTLDISDDSDNGSPTSELQERGKENIHPDRLADLLALTSEERPNAMVVEAVEKVIPQRSTRILSENREALREMEAAELEEEVQQEDDTKSEAGGVKLPTLDSTEFLEFGTPEKKKQCTTPSAPESPGFVVWESDHEAEAGSA